MNILRLTATGIILLSFAINMIGTGQEDISPEELVDDIQEYDGSMGPDNALYGLKLAFESLDESFTFNTSEKLEKKIDHSKLRIAEAKAELKKENDKSAGKAFEYYKEKIKETEGSISDIKGNDSGIIRAQKMIKNHQYILERLLESHPNNSGLMNAYNNSIELENKFEEKTDRKLERMLTKEGKHYLKEVKKKNKENSEDNDDNDDSDPENLNYELKLEASSINNDTQVKVKLEFVSNKTDNNSIANETLNRLRLNKENISRVIKISDSNDDELKSILKAQARVGSNISDVKVDYRFVLNETNRTEIINGVYNKLSNLTTEQILGALEIKTLQAGMNSEEDDDRLDENDSDNYGTTRQRKDNKRDY